VKIFHKPNHNQHTRNFRKFAAGYHRELKRSNWLGIGKKRNSLLSSHGGHRSIAAAKVEESKELIVTHCAAFAFELKGN